MAGPAGSSPGEPTRSRSSRTSSTGSSSTWPESDAAIERLWSSSCGRRGLRPRSGSRSATQEGQGPRGAPGRARGQRASTIDIAERALDEAAAGEQERANLIASPIPPQVIERPLPLRRRPSCRTLMRQGLHRWRRLEEADRRSSRPRAGTEPGPATSRAVTKPLEGFPTDCRRSLVAWAYHWAGQRTNELTVTRVVRTNSETRT